MVVHSEITNSFVIMNNFILIFTIEKLDVKHCMCSENVSFTFKGQHASGFE